MVENLVGEVDKCLPNGSCRVPVLTVYNCMGSILLSAMKFEGVHFLNSCKIVCCKVSMYRLWNVTVIPIVNTTVALKSLY